MFEVMYYCFDHDDRVIDHDADRQHQTKHRQRVYRETEQREENEGAQERNGNGEQWNDGRPNILQEDKDDDYHQYQRLDKRVQDRLDRGLDCGRCVIDDLVVHVWRKERLGMLHRFIDRFRSLQLISARQEIDRHCTAGFTVEPAERVVILRTELGSSHVLDPDNGSGARLTNDDVFEFFRCDQTAGRAESFSELLILWCRRSANFSRGSLKVLFFDRANNVGRREPQLGEAIRFDPDAHAVVSAAKEIDLRNTRNAKDLIAQIDAGVVDQKVCVVSIFR